MAFHLTQISVSAAVAALLQQKKPLWVFESRPAEASQRPRMCEIITNFKHSNCMECVCARVCVVVGLHWLDKDYVLVLEIISEQWRMSAG